MTSGGNNYNNFRENQLTKFNAVLTIKANRDQNKLLLSEKAGAI